MNTNLSAAPQAHFVADTAIDSQIDGIASGFVRVEHGALHQKRELAAQIEALLADRPEDESSDAFRIYGEKFNYVRETYEARYQWHYIDLHKTEPGDNAANQAWSRILAYTSIKPLSKAGRPRKATEQAKGDMAAKPKATASKDAADIIRAYVSALVTKKGKDQACQQIDAAQLIALAAHWDTAVRAAQDAASEVERKAAEQAKRDAEEAEAARIEAIVQARLAEMQRSNKKK